MPAHLIALSTKGKDERGVGYVKSNAIAGRCSASWSEMETDLDAWTREVADVRVHGTTGEAPNLRFGRDEVAALRPSTGHSSLPERARSPRRVGADCAVEVRWECLSVPWRLIRRTGAGHGRRRVGARPARRPRSRRVHAELKGRRGRAVDDHHLAGVAGTKERPIRVVAATEASSETPALLRPFGRV